MRVKRSVLQKIVKEELLALMREAQDEPEKKEKEKDPEPKKDPKPKVKKGDAVGPSDDPQVPPADKQPKNMQDPAGEVPEPDMPEEPPEETDEPVDTGDDMADDELDDMPGEDPGSELASEISGKVLTGVQDVKKSKTLPGARELVLTFKDSNQPLRILITRSGVVKFLFKGKLHNDI